MHFFPRARTSAVQADFFPDNKLTVQAVFSAASIFSCYALLSRRAFALDPPGGKCLGQEHLDFSRGGRKHHFLSALRTKHVSTFAIVSVCHWDLKTLWKKRIGGEHLSK